MMKCDFFFPLTIFWALILFWVENQKSKFLSHKKLLFFCIHIYLFWVLRMQCCLWGTSHLQIYLSGPAWFMGRKCELMECSCASSNLHLWIIYLFIWNFLEGLQSVVLIISGCVIIQWPRATTKMSCLLPHRRAGLV